MKQLLLVLLVSVPVMAQEPTTEDVIKAINANAQNVQSLATSINRFNFLMTRIKEELPKADKILAKAEADWSEMQTEKAALRQAVKVSDARIAAQQREISALKAEKVKEIEEIDDVEVEPVEGD